MNLHGVWKILNLRPCANETGGKVGGLDEMAEAPKSNIVPKSSTRWDPLSNTPWESWRTDNDNYGSNEQNGNKGLARWPGSPRFGKARPNSFLGPTRIWP
ncbi:hypothetical protein Nepgr_017182 [Nepenthes gracilis]|uniref:Uncharacterized protein n=1 Tax=Nepenthes gracilis TaxID=150966 RepID=A0AAD3SRK2_NEPGR|nr:hypothetical protein Nepgr_017182 [Nepenthes gracilis]